MANQDVNAEPENALTSAKDRARSPVLEQTDRSIERGKGMDTVLSAAPPDRLGVALAVAGIVLVGLNLRPAVASLSPIYEAVARSFAVGNGARSVMGSLPVFCFAIFGALTPRLARRIGLARSLALAMALVCLGQLGRAYLSHSVVIFGLLSVVALGGIGLGNVLVPQAIRHYLPQRIAQMTGLYLACTIVGASLPSLIAVPSADAIGWRNYLGAWGLFALIAVLPWLAMLGESVNPTHFRRTTLPMWRSTTAWAVTALFFVGSCLTFTLIQWLPPLLKSTDDMSPATAGVMLSIFTLVALPINLIIPGLLARMHRPYVVVGLTALCAVVGPIGLVLAPHVAWIWVVLAGVGATLLSVGVTLVNLRTSTEEGAGQLSGFMQGFGYLIAGTGPFLVGYLYAATGGWVAPCVFLASLGVVAAAAGVIAVRPGSIEDDLASPALSHHASATPAQTIQPSGPQSGSPTHGTRKTSQEIQAATGLKITAAVADVTTDSGRTTLLEACPAPDILVTNNAGPPPGSIEDWDHQAWISAWEANMLPQALMIRAVLPSMRAQKFGRIINMTSAMVKAPFPMMGLSTAARSGLTAMSKAVSHDAAVDNVTINNLLPERFDTDRTRFMAERDARQQGISFDEAIAAIANSISAKRLGRPEEFGAACAFLCSAQASYISGQNLQLDGGTYQGVI